MSDVPKMLKYQKSHEWVNPIEDGAAVIGITDHAQEALGDITFVELPEVGSRYNAGDVFGVVESVKAASDLYMPISGEVTEVNPDVNDNPDLVNQSPYESGWLVRIKIDDGEQLKNLLDSDAYLALI